MIVRVKVMGSSSHRFGSGASSEAWLGPQQYRRESGLIFKIQDTSLGNATHVHKLR